MTDKTKEFIDKAIKIHGDKYDYSKVEYIKSKDKVIIICKEHGDFLQTPGGHIQKKGCKKCGIDKHLKNNIIILQQNAKINGDKYRKTKEKFIEESVKIHGDKYNYSKVEYMKSKDKVIIICKEHGDFLQTPGGHLQGNGCKKCGFENTANNKRYNNKDFIEKAIEIHQDKYDYSNIIYISSITKVKIICKKHGEFEQTPSQHLSGAGCIFLHIRSGK